ncbi:MAG TPA: radical SAM protein, partial [Anaerovibrio sp.]|nr:radical SAM protein [Anaerovibrio sp.]
MIVYATHAGGRYLQVADSLKEQPEGKRGIYVNLTNKCNCACTFC